MMPRCAARGAALEAYAARYGIVARWVDVDTLARRMVWDAPAAGEFPKSVICDAADAAGLRPDLAGLIWHAAAGAIITAAGCDCDTPAGHADTFAQLGRDIAAHVPLVSA